MFHLIQSGIKYQPNTHLSLNVSLDTVGHRRAATCAPTSLVFFDTGQSLLVDFDSCASTRLVFFFFDIGQSLLVDFDLCAPTRLFFFDIGHLLLVDFDSCASTRLIFLVLVSRCWWTLTHLVFLSLVSRCRWTLTCALPLVLPFFDIGQLS